MRDVCALLAASLALMACQPVAPAAAPSPSLAATPAVSTPTTVSRPADGDAPAGVPAALVGEYRVAGIDGREIGGSIGLALSVTAQEIAFDPRCAGFRWSYSYQAGTLATARPAGPVCRIGVGPEEQRLATALDAVTSARRTPSNGIELSGGGHSVTLYSQ